MKKLAGLASSLALVCALGPGCTGDKVQAQEPPQDPLTACLEAVCSLCFPAAQEEGTPSEEGTPAPELAPAVPPAEIPPVSGEGMLPEEAPAEEVPTPFEEVTPEGKLSMGVSPIGAEETLSEV